MRHQRENSRNFGVCGGLAIAGLLLLLASCVPAARRAPVISRVVEFSPIPITDLPSLERGRAIYTTNCTECHHVEPIERWSVKKWREKILPEMTKKAKLTDAERADVETYVVTAHGALKQIPK
jgi:hypothetical protein